MLQSLGYPSEQQIQLVKEMEVKSRSQTKNKTSMESHINLIL